MSETRFDLLTVGETTVLVAPDDRGSIEIDARVLLGAGGAESNVAIGAAALCGTATADEIRRLFPDAPSLVVTDADIEATEVTRDERITVPSPEVEVVEPVGAGDAFAAGWLAAFHRADGPRERLEAGHAAAAIDAGCRVVALGSAFDTEEQIAEVSELISSSVRPSVERARL